MTTLAIFGDSYADTNDQLPSWNRGWPELLRDSYSVTNYGWSASSFQYTYNQFICHHADYDKCVVLVTNPHRFGHAPMQIDNKPIWFNSYGTLESVQYTGRGLLSQEDQNKLKALEMYWTYLQHLAGTFLTAPLMLNEIRRLRPDALIIPCFAWEYQDPILGTTPTMRDLQSACVRGLRPDWACDDAWWNQPQYPFREVGNICHLTQEGNQLMAQTVQAHLAQGAVWMPSWPHTVPADRPWTDYVSLPHEHSMTTIERFVSFFSNPRVR